MTVSAQLKTIVTQRAGGLCEYCLSQARYSATPFSVEHIVPVSKEGRTDLDNLALACQGCNNFKYSAIDAVDPLTGKLVRLFNPRQDQWSTHFRWTNDKLKIIGVTPIGRGTVSRLKLNREGVVNLRHALASVGMHPPI